MNLSFKHIFKKSKSDNKKCLLLLHGTGGNEEDLIPLAEKIDENAAILSPRGKVLENGMPRFFRRLAPGIFDLEDLKFRTNELHDFIIKSKVYYEINDYKLIAIGYSNGANMALSLLFSYPDSLEGCILFRPMVPYEPNRELKLKNKKILVLAGLYDELISKEETQRLVSILKEKEAEVELNWARSGHALVYDELMIARKWYEKHFK